MKIERLNGSLCGYWRAEDNNLASYGQTEKEAVQLLKELMRRKNDH